jgi:N-ethylmaleimide reductase
MLTPQQNHPNLFSPITIGELELSNRIIMAPLTRNRAAEGNVPQAMNVEYYRQRASAGLIISEGSQISPQGLGYPGTPGIYSDAQVAGWQKVTDAVHQAGGKIFLQLWHVGRSSHSSMQPNSALPVAPSAIKPKGQIYTYTGMQDFETPRALTTEEIPGIIADFVNGAKNAKSAGFDGVEIHSANGYLLDQFIRDSTNQRQDQYGGDIGNRMRLLIEVTEHVVEVWGKHRVGVRLSPENSFNDMKDSNPQQTFNEVAKGLSGLSLAYLHILEGDMMTGERQLDYVELRKCFNGYYMANNGYDFESGNASISEGRAEMIAFGKMFIANPDLPYRFANKLLLNEPDSATFYGGDEKGYIDYPMWDGN